MPKEKSIGVSKETLKLLKDYQREFKMASLDQAIVNAIAWAKIWYTVDHLKRRELVQRVSSLEFEVAKLKKALKTS